VAPSQEVQATAVPVAIKSQRDGGKSTTTRMLRRSREPLDNWRCAGRRSRAQRVPHRRGDEGFSHNVYEVRASHVETALDRMDALLWRGFDYDADTHSAVLDRETTRRAYVAVRHLSHQG